MTEQKFSLDRENNIEANVDALGKKWKIYRNKGNGLCFTRPEPDRSDSIIPEHMTGLWTKKNLLEEQVNKYVVDTWAVADKVLADNERKAKAAAESAALAKKVAKDLKAKNDTGKSSK